jgi:asparagine synthase (glutamine-hydrolysing)
VIAMLSRSGCADQAVARRMLAAAPHRGSCMQLQVLGNCVLGVSNRPDFTDTTLSSTGPIIAALSGTLDNAAELGNVVATAGFTPASPAPADVVVAAFRAFGPDAPSRMRGTFAGLVTDGTTLWCFRDHIGFRPLFYRDDARVFVAAGEARQVLVGANLSAEPDCGVLEQILYGRMGADTPAALKGVSRLPQATTLTVDCSRQAIAHRYWSPTQLLETAHLTAGDVGERFADLFSQAVARCLTGCDAVSLSGGLDSPAIAAFAALAHGGRGRRPIGAVSAVFPDLPAVDERRHIELVADRFGLELHTYRPQARGLDDVEQWCRVLGGPVPMVSIPEFSEHYSLARRLGYGNLLSGEFAELAFGSPRHLLGHLLTHQRWRALGTLLLAEHRRGTSWRTLARHLCVAMVPGRAAVRYLHWRRRDAPQRIPDWLDARKVNEVPYRTDLLPPARLRWVQEQVGAFEGSTITMEADELCAAAAGITVRRPFADIDLWEFFLSLPAEIRCPDLRYKTLARGLLRGTLPDEIVNRHDKTVFDDHIMSQIDYATLERYLVNPRHRLPGVDYRRLAGRLAQRNFNRVDWTWAVDLTRIHAFLSAW